jgi:hypothetical protein
MDQLNCGYLEPFNSVGVDGKLRNITTIQQQTAPLPYTSLVDGQEWATDNSWTHFDVWDPPNSLGVDGTPIDWNIVWLSHEMDSGDKDITLLGLILEAPELAPDPLYDKTLTIEDPTAPFDEYNDGQGLFITHYLLLNGNIDLVGESQLVQKRYTGTQYSPSILDEISDGYLERDQQGTRSSFNYNYWSSPVSYQGGANNAPFTISQMLRDGTNSLIPGAISYGDHWSYADGALSSPIKLSNYWFWKFNGDNGVYADWFHIGSTGEVLAGDGYTQKGTDGTASISDRQNYVFKGKPNNEFISLNIDYGNNRLIGNPYPSAIDADAFILDNIAQPVGNRETNIINGTLYFWDHFSGATHILSGYIGGYATYTLIGGVRGRATDYRVNATGDYGSEEPERYIPVSQGFFVGAVSEEDPYVEVTGGDIHIKNSHRVFQREVDTDDNTGSYFLKTQITKNKKKTIVRELDTRPRIRLNFRSPLGYHRQLLVGIDENTTNSFDIGYDAPLIENNDGEDIYWLINERKFVIQGVNNFNSDQELPLGLKIDESGVVSIKIERLENISEELSLFIKDKFTGETHAIKNQSFVVTLDPGEYHDRFALVFQPRLKYVDEVELFDGIHIIMDNEMSEIQIKKIIDTEITGIKLFNYLGQNIRTWNSNFTERQFSLPVEVATGVYIVEINTLNGSINKRIIIE